MKKVIYSSFNTHNYSVLSLIVNHFLFISINRLVLITDVEEYKVKRESNIVAFVFYYNYTDKHLNLFFNSLQCEKRIIKSKIL